MTGRRVETQRVRVLAAGTDGQRGYRFTDARCIGSLGVIRGVATHPASGEIVDAFIIIHVDTGRFILPRGWFFEAEDAAIDAVGRVLDRLHAAARDDDDPAMAEWRARRAAGELTLAELAPLRGAFLQACREAGVVAGPWHELRQLGARVDYEESDRMLSDLREKHAAQRAREQA